MKKTLLALGILLMGAGHAAAALSPVELTKRYAFSVLRLGYMDHFHHEEKGNAFHLSFAGLSFAKNVQMDPFFTFEEGLREFGFAFPVKLHERFLIAPAIFNNFDAKELGFAVTAAIILR